MDLERNFSQEDNINNLVSKRLIHFTIGRIRLLFYNFLYNDTRTSIYL